MGPVRSFYEAAADILPLLYSRWKDERGYEDIQSYSQPLQKLAAEHGVEIVRMTAKPFGCLVASTAEPRPVYQIKVTNTYYTMIPHHIRS